MFPYFGSIKKLQAVLKQHRPVMETVYRDILGKKFFEAVKRTDENILCPESFRQLASVEQAIGVQARYRGNKFFEAIWLNDDPTFSSDGGFRLRGIIKSAPGFIFSEEGFALSQERYQSWISSYLAPYVHEYDHFVIWALQELPMTLATQLLVAELKPERLPLQPEDIQSLVSRREGTESEKICVIKLAVWLCLLDDLYENTTRKLDAAIFRALGYQVPDEYDEVPPKEFVPFPVSIRSGVETIDIGAIFATAEIMGEDPVNALGHRGILLLSVAVGDHLEGRSLSERLGILHQWHNRFKPSSSTQQNFMQSLRGVKFERIPFSRILRAMERAQQKK